MTAGVDPQAIASPVQEDARSASTRFALSPREVEVAALLCAGIAQKVIAYELGLAPSTVGFHARGIATKVGARTTADAVRILASDPLAAGDPVGDPTRHPALRGSHGPTEAEIAVGALAIRGLSNQAIARIRASSPRTVRNQLSSLFRKLEVGARAELAARHPWLASTAVLPRGSP